jgi:hypothetical protein
MVVERIIKKGIGKRKGKKRERGRKEKEKERKKGGERRDYLSTVFNRVRDNIRRFNRM